MYGSFRIREKVQTKRPKERPTKLLMRAAFGDKEKDYLMPIEGVIATLPWVHFLPPGYLREPRIKEFGWNGATLEVRVDAPRNKSLCDRSNASTFSVTQKFDLDSLARTLAKIAHALCIGEFGSSFFEPWLLPYILGTDLALSYLVGGMPESLAPVSELHQLRYNAGQRRMARVRGYSPLCPNWRTACHGDCRRDHRRACALAPRGEQIRQLSGKIRVRARLAYPKRFLLAQDQAVPFRHVVDALKY
jgi:hypothetical protein